MKNWILLTLIASAAGAAAWLARPAPKPVPVTPAGYAPMSERFDPVAAAEGARAAAAVAAEAAAEPPAEPLPSTLTRAELEAKIREVDERLERERLIERGNLGQLDEAGRRDLRRLLDRRNQLMVRKIDLDLGEG